MTEGLNLAFHHQSHSRSQVSRWLMYDMISQLQKSLSKLISSMFIFNNKILSKCSQGNQKHPTNASGPRGWKLPTVRCAADMYNIIVRVNSKKHCNNNLEHFPGCPGAKLYAPNAGDPGSILGQGPRPYMLLLRVCMLQLRPGAA